MLTVNDKTFVIGPVRLSYLNVFRPRLNTGKTPPRSEYSVQLMLPKTAVDKSPKAKEEFDALKAFCKDLATKKWGADAKFLTTIKDGDKETKEDGSARNPGYYTFPAASPAEWDQPCLMDAKRNEVVGGWESGDWGKVKIKAYTYENNGKKGIGFGLIGVQFLYVDEHFSSSSAEGFGEEEGDSVAQSAPATSAASDEYDPFADD